MGNKFGATSRNLWQTLFALSETQIQISPFTVKPLGQGKSVTVGGEVCIGAIEG